MIESIQRDQAQALLENWGEWVRDDWQQQLGYGRPPSSKGYLSPRKDYTPQVRMPVNVTEAEIAFEALILIGTNPVPTVQRIYEFIVAKWAFNRQDRSLAEKFKCSVSTVQRRKLRAYDVFWEEYHKVRVSMAPSVAEVSNNLV